ncbi:MAG: YqgE/AlgH family protein [Pseudomonadota bacterium]|nr:YqgE/AlgH family protein [Pseudomonadota bacterium]
MSHNPEVDLYLAGQLLIAMPGMRDERFSHTGIYMCAHSEEGAMGLVLNQVLDALSFSELLSQLGIEGENPEVEIPVHFGGPVEAGRGFVLHTTDFKQDATLEVDGEIALTATIDILKAMSRGRGPRRHLLALGYAGWGPGQLDQEIRQNGWLQAPADSEIIFDSDLESKWDRSIGVIGVDPRMLSDEAGHA